MYISKMGVHLATAPSSGIEDERGRILQARCWYTKKFKVYIIASGSPAQILERLCYAKVLSKDMVVH